MSYQYLLLGREDAIATITLNRPEKLNALNTELLEGELPAVVHEVCQDESVRVVIVTGAGRGFCSGADVSRLEALASGAKRERSRQTLVSPIGAFSLEMRKSGKPFIAAINGVAAGAGFSLAMACDIRIATENARFGSLFVRRGLMPDCGLTYFLPHIVGTAKALELMFTGEVVDAKEAERIGLVNKVVPQDELMPVTKELAQRLAKGPPIALEFTKRAVYTAMDTDLETAFVFETYGQRVCISTEDLQEGVKSFFEQREPVFKGK